MSTMRISGIASGMDIDKMVSDLMKAQRMPLDKLKQNKQILEWQRDDFRSMNTLLLGFRSDVFNMKLSSVYRTKSTTSSDETRVSATASPSAGTASYSITEVNQLASAATKVSTSMSGTVKIDPAKAMFTTRNQYGLKTEDLTPATDTTTLKISGVPISSGSVKLTVGNVSYQSGDPNAFTNNSPTTLYDSTGASVGSINLTTGDITMNSIITANTVAKAEYQPTSAFNWKTGSVESASFTVTDDTKTKYDLLPTPNPNGLAVSDLANTTVKVNGVSYSYVSDIKAVSTDPNRFTIDSTTGQVVFASPLSKGSSISVNYIANKRVDTFTPTAATKTIQLSKGSITADGSAVIKLDNNGTIQNLNINSAVTDSSKPNIRELKDSNSNAVVGSIDLDTGLITMADNNDIAANTVVTATYKQNYFSFNMSTNTSKGVMSERFNIQGTESLNQVMQKMNNSNLGVSAFYDSFSDKISLTRTESGNFNTSGAEMDTSSSFLSSVLGLSTTETGGANAEFTINGLHTERTSNTFDMNGVSITLKKQYTLVDPSVTIGVNNNIDATVDNIKKFVEKYNDVIGKIQDKVEEKRYKDYLPLTDDQKEQLSDTQQEQWTTNAKSGLLRRDPILSGVLDKMRSNFNSPVSSSDGAMKYNQMSSIGITTSPNYLEGGKLYLDEAKLRQALQDDPSSVEKLFNNSGTASDQQGIAQRLYDTLNGVMDQIKQRAGNSLSTNQQFTIGKNLNNLDSSILSFEDRMKQVEDRYYRQFTAMEQAMQKSNSQATYMQQQFGGGQ